ncbi:MAG: Holliday junction branch migration protein RuvA [Rhodospirillaceae bacterium]|nr:Holliday junction branch migration protein RuvA [Rhodospirillaceae bacterium]
MIGKLKGRVDSIGADGAVIDVNGVGYEVFCSARTLAALPALGGAVDLTIETHVREDHIHLYAFASTLERDVFRVLMTVQGVGAKVALAILSALTAPQIAQAVAAGDQTAFRRASGVGPKLAQRLAVELKDKLPAFGGIALATTAASPRAKAAAPGGAASPVEDAVSALVNLGYGRMDAFAAVSRAAAADAAAPVAALIKLSLRELGSRDLGAGNA